MLPASGILVESYTIIARPSANFLAVGGILIEIVGIGSEPSCLHSSACGKYVSSSEYRPAAKKIQIRIMSAPDILDVPFLHELFHTATRLMESGMETRTHCSHNFTRAERIHPNNSLRLPCPGVPPSRAYARASMPLPACVHPSRTLVLLPYRRNYLLDNPAACWGTSTVIGPMHPYFNEILDAAGMVGVHVGDDYFPAVSPLSVRTIPYPNPHKRVTGINQSTALSFSPLSIHGKYSPKLENTPESSSFQQGNLYLFILE